MQNLKNNLIEINPKEFLKKFLVRVDEKIQNKTKKLNLDSDKGEKS